MKAKFLIVEKDYRMYYSNKLTRYIRRRCEEGTLSVVNMESLRGMNSNAFVSEYGAKWSPIHEWKH